MTPGTVLPTALLARVEDASVNASAPPQQRWIDGWLVRFSPGKAKRARSVQALADGRQPLDERLRAVQAVYAAAGLPTIVRVTPFSRPAGLDAALQVRGFHAIDDTRVMVAATLEPHAPGLPDGVTAQRLGAAEFAEQIGVQRESPPAQREAHAQRLLLSPVPIAGWVLRAADGAVLALAQCAIEGDLAGLYDVFTPPAQRGQGWARRLCATLLAQAHAHGARVGYLQVDAANAPARAVYRRLGFVDGYAYHYRTPDPAAH